MSPSITSGSLLSGAEGFRPHRRQLLHFPHQEAQVSFENFSKARARSTRRDVLDRSNLANAKHRLTESSLTKDRPHFLQLPGELRNRIYRLLLTSKEVKRTVKNGAPIYEFTPSILGVNRQIHDEALGILYFENTFIGITATCLPLRKSVTENFLPRISMRSSITSHTFPPQALQVQLSCGPVLTRNTNTFELLIVLEDLPAFCAMLWMCCSVCKDLGRNGVIDLRIPYSYPPKLIDEQRQLLLPFRRIHSFREVNITGTVNPSLSRALVTAITGSRTFVAKQIVDAVLRLDREVNAAALAGDFPTGLFKSRQAFATLMEVMHPRFRGSHSLLLTNVVLGGPFHGKQFFLITVELGFKMVMTLVFMYIEMEKYEKAHALAKHTLERIQHRFRPSKENVGKLILFQGVASEYMMELERAEKEFNYALVFIPNEHRIIQRLVNVRLRIRVRAGDPLARLTHEIFFAERGEGTCCSCDRERFLGKIPAA
ncbi:MAG: hypothetical protein M1812_003363 [Candelaria pacifica]|nr:MAG: hypothetical protein M1812_003363 [Candelaria pacifica]